MQSAGKRVESPPLPSRYLTPFKPSSLTKFLTPTIDVWVLILIKPLYPALPLRATVIWRLKRAIIALPGRGEGAGGSGGKGSIYSFSSFFSGPSLVETSNAFWTLCSLPFLQYAKYQDQNPPPKPDFSADRTSRRYIAVLFFCSRWDYLSLEF